MAMKREEEKKRQNDAENEENEPALISGEPEQEEYAPVLRVLIAVAYMGALAAVVGAMAAVLSIVSGGEARQKLALTVGAFVLFGAAAAVLSLIDRKKRRSFEREKNAQLEKSERIKGEVVSVEKHIKKVKYMTDSFEELSWRFVIRVSDEKDGEREIKSGRYLNDISNVLKSTAVTVIEMPDGARRFEGFELRERGEQGVTLPVAEVEDE